MPEAAPSEKPTPAKKRGVGLLVGAGLASLLALAAVAVVVVKYARPKDKGPDAPDTTNSEPKEKPKEKDKPVPKAADPDRAAAEWVLSVKGKARIKDAAGERSVEDAKELPAGAFTVTEIDLAIPPAPRPTPTSRGLRS